MRENGLKRPGKAPVRLHDDSDHTLPVAPNLLDRHFETDAPNRVWVGT